MEEDLSSPPPAKIPCWSQGSSASGDGLEHDIAETEECYACGSLVPSVIKKTKAELVIDDIRLKYLVIS